MISVILVQHNRGALTLQAIRSLQAHHQGGYEVLMVDNASNDGSLELLQREARGIRILPSPTNDGFGAANNRAAQQAAGDILLFLNNDTICVEPFLQQAEAAFGSEPSMGVLGPRLVNEDRSFQLSAGTLPSIWRESVDKVLHGAARRRVGLVTKALEGSFSSRRTVGWVTGAALFIRRELFERVGGYDESMFMYFEDKDLCARCWRAGMRVVYEPRLEIVHLKGGSSSGPMPPLLQNAYRASQVHYYRTHRPRHERLLLNAYLRVRGRTPHV